MLKEEARKIFKEKRGRLSPTEKIKYDDLLLIQFQKLPLPFLSVVLSFYPIEENKEVNTFILTDYLSFKYPHLQIAYPKSDTASASMQAIVCDDDTLFEKNRWNIHEPAACEMIAPQDIDLVLIPMLGFDKEGNRVGYGKGYYDHFLKECSEDCLKVGVCYFEPVEQIEDASEFDVPLDFCITPQKVYVF